MARGTNLFGIANMERGKFHSLGSKGLFVCLSNAPPPAMSSSFTENVRCVHQRVGTLLVLIANVHAWEPITVPDSPMVAGTKLVKRSPSCGEYNDIPSGFSKRQAQARKRTLSGTPAINRILTQRCQENKETQWGFRAVCTKQVGLFLFSARAEQLDR